VLTRKIRDLLPPAVRSRVKRAMARVRGLTNFYERVYEQRASMLLPEESIGGGEFELIGKIELGLLILEGLRPSDTVIDLGCGTGRLAVHLIPHLRAGRYLGIDISKAMLREGARRTAGLADGCSVEWKHQRTSRFDLPDGSADVLCAFSVFTHMEVEDTYRYLVGALPVVRPGGKLIFSCLPLSLEGARKVFLDQARLDLHERWAGIRNVVTTEESMETLASMSGWKVVRWYRGDLPSVPVPGLATPQALGQSTCVLQRPS
jgi:ubiquinone/menaquinone biosynthesis C-methylase UbiE